jgi:NTP pyrophosphatase (non-canonical NTP hydrolase)
LNPASIRFEELVADLEANFEFSPWAKTQGLRGWAAHLAKEVEEMRHEIGINDSRVGDELGDVLWNWISTVLALEAIGGPSMDIIIQKARAKLRLRKPWIFDGSEVPSDPEAEHALYLKMKAKVG